MADEPSPLKELACKAVSALCFNTLTGFPSALPQYFEEEALKTMLIPVREICLEKLNELVPSKVHASERPLMDYCTILEGILDDHHESLEINTPLPHADRSSFSKLMSVLAHRCPKLRYLEITFFDNHRGMELAVTPSASHLPFHLDHLKSLTLFRSHYYYYYEPLPEISLATVFDIIGQTCPNLEELDFSDFPHTDEKMSILALLLGQDLARALFLFPLDGNIWARDSVLYKLRIPTKYLSPICFTLQSLNPYRVRHYGAEYAFALRHLPKLRYWCYKNNRYDLDIPVYLIKSLGRAEEEKELPAHQLQQEAFEVACRTSAATLNFGGASSTTLMSGPLSSITMIDFVSVRDWNAVTAVGLMCPNLTFIGFEDAGNADDYVSTYSSLLYEKMFKDCWSMDQKPSNIHLKRLNPDFFKILVNFFGSSLRSLALIDCHRINLSDLWQCTQLEHLYVTDSTINGDASDPAIRTSGTFLPSLLKVECCSDSFPIWSFWLESKSGLIKLRE